MAENNSRIQAAGRETNYLGRHQMFINVSLLSLFVCILCQKDFQFRSLDSAAVKCLECFLLSFGLFSFLKKPRVAQAQARRLSMRKQDTAGPEIVPFPSSSGGSEWGSRSDAIAT